MTDDATRGSLPIGTPHPAAESAMRYLQKLPLKDLALWSESFASCAIGGNLLAEVCSETLRRLMAGEPVSDRYLLGLAWTIQNGGTE